MYKKQVVAFGLFIGLWAGTLVPQIALGRNAESSPSSKQHRARLGKFRKVEKPRCSPANTLKIGNPFVCKK
jgi:hypothetical protein